MDLENIIAPKNPDKFFPWLKENSERYWQTVEINGGIYGFQIQKGTKWLPGLSEQEVAEYEKEMGFSFPEVYKLFLKHMNGTDIPTINIYGQSGEPYQYAFGYYSYPRDLSTVKEQIEWIYEEFGVTPEFIDKNRIPRIMPIVGHRFLVMDHCAGAPVLSMYGRDTIYYGRSLESFLIDDIFEGGRIMISADTAPVEVKFWLDDETATELI